MLANLGKLYVTTGRFGEAAAAIEEAAAIRRELAEREPAAYLPGLAGTLGVTAIFYAETERYDEAAELETTPTCSGR